MTEEELLAASLDCEKTASGLRDGSMVVYGKDGKIDKKLGRQVMKNASDAANYWRKRAAGVDPVNACRPG